MVLLTSCHFCYLGIRGLDGWKFDQYISPSLLPVLYSVVAIACTEVRLLPSQELDPTESGFTWRSPKKCTAEPVLGIDHSLLQDIKYCLWYFWNVSAFPLSHHSCSKHALLFPASWCMNWLKPHSESICSVGELNVCGWWWDPSLSSCQWDWMRI